MLMRPTRWIGGWGRPHLSDESLLELHAMLDSWQIVAFRRITWLERPGVAPVALRASGGASWVSVGGGDERREEVLEFRGDIER